MTMKNIQALVLAAGKSSRFKTGKTKLLEKICGQAMVLYPTRLLESMHIPTNVIVGFQKELVQEAITQHHNDTVSFIVQPEQQGTGHAILCSKPSWNQDHILIINGDVPLVEAETIQELYTKHTESAAVISFITAHNADPSLGGYGRIVHQDNLIEIVEAKDFTGDVNKHCCINAGIYIVAKNFLEQCIDDLTTSNKSNEFYFTDIVKIASQKGLTVTTVSAPFDRIRGINTFQELWVAEQIKRGELIKNHMENGVHFSVAQNVHIDLDVTIGAGSSIGSGVHLLGTTRIGTNCQVHEFSSLDNTVLGDSSIVFSHCSIKNSSIGTETRVGPFAHVHTQTHIGDNSVIGNFVEIKKTSIGNNTKAKHLVYLGDANIGSHVNIGAGTIICNHNGISKNTTTIHDGAFIGSNNTLVAPLTIGKQAFTAAGSVITETVPADALAIGRTRQVNKEGYASLIRQRAEQKPAPTPETDGSFVGALKTNKTPPTIPH